MTAVAKHSIGRGARVSEPDYVSFGSRPCLRRHGAGRLRDRTAKDGTLKHSGLKAPEPGYIHIDVKYPPHMANKRRKDISLWQSTGPAGGSSLAYIATKQPQLPVAF